MEATEKVSATTVAGKKITRSTEKKTVFSNKKKSTSAPKTGTAFRVVTIKHKKGAGKKVEPEDSNDWLTIYDVATGIFSRRVATKQSSLTDAYLTISKAIYSASDLERVSMIRKGLPAKFLVEMGRTMDISNDLLLTTLALPRSTIVRKIQKQEPLSAEQSERVIGLERLVGQVEQMVKQSGDATDFDAGRWLGEWLQRPLPALAGKKPAEFMDTMVGQNLLSKLLSQSQSGAYA